MGSLADSACTFQIDLEVSKKDAKFARSVKENSLIIYAPSVMARGTSAYLFKFSYYGYREV